MNGLYKNRGRVVAPIYGANRHDMKLVEPTLESMVRGRQLPNLVQVPNDYDGDGPLSTPIRHSGLRRNPELRVIPRLMVPSAVEPWLF